MNDLVTIAAPLAKGPIFNLYREGDFTADLVPTNQCGKLGQAGFQFKCGIIVDTLDAQGFVIDQFHIPNLFEKWKKGPFEASCEQLCCGALVELCKSCQGRALALRVQVKPILAAHVELTWLRGMALPTLLPISRKPVDAAPVVNSPKLSFGKFKGRRLDEVPTSYLAWLNTQAFTHRQLKDAVKRELVSR